MRTELERKEIHKLAKLRWILNHLEQYRATNRRNHLDYMTRHPELKSKNNRSQKQWSAHNKTERIPLANTCEICNSNEHLVRHHPDYKYPKIFVTLYQSCHMSVHRGNMV